MLILAEQPGVASLSFATPGYKSVALRAIVRDPRLIPINQKIGSNRIENPYIQFRQITNQPAH